MNKVTSRNDQIAEIIKCGKDPEYFIKTYTKIQHPIRGTIPFDTYEFQDDCVRQFQDHRLNIILKSRQLGLSTICAAYAVWMAIFQKDKNILVIATKLATAQNFIKKTAVILHNLPKWLLLPKFDQSKQQLSFNNGSQIKAIPTSDDAGRSEALSLLIIDEAAFIKDFESIWTGLAPAFSTGGRAIVLSTPNGVGGQYYSLWMGAINGSNGFNPIKIMWDQHPEHDQDWFDKETKNLSKKKVAQEFLCDFTSSGDTFLHATELERLINEVKQPIERLGEKRDIWVWENPQVGRNYILCADVARGDAKDYSAFHIIDSKSCEVVAEYMGKIPPEKFAVLCEEWGFKYNTAFIICELNTFGYFVNVSLRDKGYKKLYYSKHPDGDPFSYVPIDPSELPGFDTQTSSRTKILSKLEELIRNNQIKVYSQRLYDQLQSFVWVGNKPQALKDNHDDLVLSLAIGCWILEGSTAINKHQHALTVAMLQSTQLSRKDSSQMPNEVNSIKPLTHYQQAIKSPNMMNRPINHSQVRNLDISDFRWLLR